MFDINHFVTNKTKSLLLVTFKLFHPSIEPSITQLFSIKDTFAILIANKRNQNNSLCSAQNHIANTDRVDGIEAKIKIVLCVGTHVLD